jgi:hypothetical protein
MIRRMGVAEVWIVVKVSVPFFWEVEAIDRRCLKV